MTYGELKLFTSSLLTGDKRLPEEDDILIPMVAFGLLETAKRTTSTRLQSTDHVNDVVVKQITQNLFIKQPATPTLNGDVIELEEELCYALGNFIASKYSKEKGGIYYSAWKKMCEEFDSNLFDHYDNTKKSNMPDFIR